MFEMSKFVEIWVFAGLGVLALMLIMGMIARLVRKAGPHEALVVYGFRGTRVVKGHGTIVLPMATRPTAARRHPLLVTGPPGIGR